MAPRVQGPAQQFLSPEHLPSEVLHRTGSPSLCSRELWTCLCCCTCLIAGRSASSSRLLVLLVFSMAMPRAEPGIQLVLKECLYPVSHSLCATDTLRGKWCRQIGRGAETALRKMMLKIRESFGEPPSQAWELRLCSQEHECMTRRPHNTEWCSPHCLSVSLSVFLTHLTLSLLLISFPLCLWPSF